MAVHKQIWPIIGIFLMLALAECEISVCSRKVSDSFQILQV